MGTSLDVTAVMSEIQRHMHVQIDADRGGRVTSVAVAIAARMIAVLGLAICFVGSARLWGRTQQVGWGAHGCGAQECVMVILLTCGNALGVHETLTRALGQPKLSDLTAT